MSPRVDELHGPAAHQHVSDFLVELTDGSFLLPSRDLVGGVAQAQSTVRRALQDIGEALPGRAPDGADLPGDETWLTQPRSFLVIGHSEQLLGEAGGPHRDKIHAFEQYRRNLSTREVITFDELLARAEWVVQVEGAVDGPDEDTDF